jgi:hypothetical protein
MSLYEDNEIVEELEEFFIEAMARSRQEQSQTSNEFIFRKASNHEKSRIPSRRPAFSKNLFPRIRQ